MKNTILSLITLLSLWFALFYFLMTITSIADAKTISTFVTVAQNEEKIVHKTVYMHTRVLENPCNSCIKLCEGRQRCEETCFINFCNK